ncbi:MAG: GIY-YIG nuclease family protein [Candidatus Liptonbacteria bacterium]|nr:GIY-YIG nuclease family protein [Candidatus Liptonbacteria bacterium]
MESLRDKRLYVGSTTDLRSRFRHHRGGFTWSTKRFGELRLVFSQEFSTIEVARSVEKKLKKLKRRDYLEKIIKERKIRMRV